MCSELTSAAQARAADAKRYFTGLPCKSGHIAERFTNRSVCVECHRLAYARTYSSNKTKRIERVAAWAAQNQDRVLANKAAYRERNREKLAQKNRDYKQRKPHLVTKHAALRRAQKKVAQPPWVRELDLMPLYEEARRLTVETGVAHSVDHEVPLKHPLVCGLHVPWNLRVMPLIDNIRKGNKWESQ